MEWLMKNMNIEHPGKRRLRHRTSNFECEEKIGLRVMKKMNIEHRTSNIEF